MSIEVRSQTPDPQRSRNLSSAPSQAHSNGLAADGSALPSTGSERSDQSPGLLVRTWLVRGAIAGGIMAVIVAALIWMPAGSSSSIGPQLTHTVKRGNLSVKITEQGMLESSDNTEIKCKVRGQNTVIWVVESGAIVEPGDVLVRLDTLELEDSIAERTKYAHWSRSSAVMGKANVARLRLAVSEYEEGRFPAQVMRMEKDLAIAESNLTSARAMLKYSQMMEERGYESALEVQQREFRVKQNELDVEVRKTELQVLKDYTRRIELEEIKGNLNAAIADLAASEERADMDEERRDLAKKELEHCVIRAERGGLVIYPSAAAWKSSPDIEEGASVHKDQVLLLMPDLTKMQVKVGVHESVVDRVKPGLIANVTLPDKTLVGEVISVASITSPAGWWTGNVVKYDTIIQLPAVEGLKPGMSAEVEILVKEHEDVVTVPVAAVVETNEGFFCWVKSGDEVKKRSLKLGDNNDVYIVVEAGLKEGDEVVLNPIAYVDEAQDEVLKPSDKATRDSSDSPPAKAKSPENTPEK